VSAVGTHNKLVAHNGQYAELYTIQTKVYQ